MAAVVFICFFAILMQTHVLGFKCIRETLSPNEVNEGYIKSPNYPREYPLNVCFIWYHMVSRETKVVIVIEDLDIPSIDNCRSNSSNRLLIGPHDKRQYCGVQRSGITYEAVISDHFYVVFIIAERFLPRGRGFLLHYKLSIPDNQPSAYTSKSSPTTKLPPRHIEDVTRHHGRVPDSPCFFTMNEAAGFITIPKDMVSQGHSFNVYKKTCTWLLQTTDSHNVGTSNFRYAFWFAQFHFYPDCCSLDIFEGSGSNRGRRVGHYLSDSHPHSLYAQGPQVFVQLTFKDYGYFGNFSIQFMREEICMSGYKPCGHNESSCYPANKRCDGVWDCPLNGGDERGCTASCADHKFSCGNTSDYCFSEEDRCNGKGACANYRDEKDCTASQCSSVKGLFLCRNKRCIYEKWRCDHTKDCEDGSDEEACDRLTSPRLMVACVVGTLISSLLLVLALSFAMRVYALRMRRRHGAEAPVRQDSPLSRIEQDLIRRRAPPPQYNEAMMTSRSYDEAYLELLSQGQANNIAENSQEGGNNTNTSGPTAGSRRERSGRRGSNRRRSGRDRRLHRNLRTQQHLHGCSPLLPPPPAPLHHFTEQPPSYLDSTSGAVTEMSPSPPQLSATSMQIASENHLSVTSQDIAIADGRNHEIQSLSSPSPATNTSTEPVPPPYSLHSDLPSASSGSDDDDDIDDDDDDMIGDVDEDVSYINRNFSSSSSLMRRVDGDDNCLLLRGGNSEDDDDNLDDEDDEEGDTCLSVIPESTHSHLMSFTAPPLPLNTTISSDLMMATELTQMSSIIKEDDTDDDNEGEGVKREEDVVVATTKDSGEEPQTTLLVQDSSNSENGNVADCLQKEKETQPDSVSGSLHTSGEDDDDECILSSEADEVEPGYYCGDDTSDTACLLAS